MNDEWGGKRAVLRGAAMVAIVTGLLVLGRLLPVEQWLQLGRRWLDGMELWGPVAFVGIYVLATNLGVPGSPLTVSAGILFGTWTGLAVAMVSSTLSACSMFLIARRIGWTLPKTKDGRLLARVRRLLVSRGPWVVALSRLVPFPFLVLNYAFGLTPVPFRTYAVWSFVGMIPMNVLFVTGGEAFAAWAEQGSVPAPLLAAVAAVGLVAAGLAFLARRWLRQDRRR